MKQPIRIEDLQAAADRQVELAKEAGVDSVIENYDNGLLTRIELIGLLSHLDGAEEALAKKYPELVDDLRAQVEARAKGGRQFIIFGGC